VITGSRSSGKYKVTVKVCRSDNGGQAQSAELLNLTALPQRSIHCGSDKIAMAAGSCNPRPGAAWIGLSTGWSAEGFPARLPGPDLYNGRSGITLFLAARLLRVVSLLPNSPARPLLT
jgi:hypothetical protein